MKNYDKYFLKVEDLEGNEEEHFSPYGISCQKNSLRPDNLIKCVAYFEEDGVVESIHFDTNDFQIYDDKKRLKCKKSKIYGTRCEIKSPRSIEFPIICSRNKENADEISCIPEEQSEINYVFGELLRGEELKPGMIRTLIDHNVRIKLLPPEKMHKEFGIPVKGTASCSLHSGEITLNSDYVGLLSTLMHEYAHCKENIEREKKGLPPLKIGETGKWEKIDEKFIPIGHEVRAEKFEVRMMRKKGNFFQ